MTRWEFTAICVEYAISPGIVWENEAFRELVNSDKLNAETLRQVLKEQF